MSKIIRVEPTVPSISLTWMLGARCNYDCMYCPAELHDKTSKHPELDDLKRVWMNFYSKTKDSKLPYKISFSGGEVTANKSFLPLIEYLRSENFNISHIIITTNGSASLKYYKQLSKVVEAISFSTHSEFFNEQEFFDKVKAIDALMIRPEKSLHVNIMNEFWNQDRIKLYVHWLEQQDISYSINDIDYSSKTRLTPLAKGALNFNYV